jgi:rRNA maturation RNase YbeY
MVRVEVFNTHPTRRVAVGDARLYVRRVLRTCGVKRGRVGVVFVDSRFSRRINKRYLGHDYATDVLSFSLENGPILDGEVYVNLDRAKKQAGGYSVSFRNEVARLVIHGTLHLAGFDDTAPRKATRMKAEEDQHVQYWFP